MGARFRLKAGVDISQLTPQSRVIAQAMKDLRDDPGGQRQQLLLLRREHSSTPATASVLTWDDNDIQGTTHGLKSLHFSDFEVVDTDARR